MLYLYVGPALNWIATYQEAGRQRAQVAELRAENERLRERKAELTAPGALEREARRLGMVKAGERAYIVEGLPSTVARPFYPAARVSYETAREQWEQGCGGSTRRTRSRCRRSSA